MNPHMEHMEHLSSDYVNRDFFFSYNYTLFFLEEYYAVQKPFSLTRNGPWSAFLRNFVQKPLIIVWMTVTSISFSFLLTLPKSSASLFASYPLAQTARAKAQKFSMGRG
jgi:hypothetical protein